MNGKIKVDFGKEAAHFEAGRKAGYSAGYDEGYNEGLANAGPSEFSTDDAIAYRKTVPDGVASNAIIKRIGGITQESKQLVRLRNINGTWDGVTVTTNEDGSYTFNGRAAWDTNFELWNYHSDGGGDVGYGKTLRMSVETDGRITWDTGSYGFVWFSSFYDDLDEEAYPEFEESLGPDGRAVYIPSSPSYWLHSIFIYFPEGAEIDNVTVRIMVNEGDEWLPYQPYSRNGVDAKVTGIVCNDGSDIVSVINFPEAVQKLNGYGIGKDATNYNYIEWRDGRCYFVQKVTKEAYAFEFNILPEPIETDITDIMGTNMHVRVKGGGTVEFANTSKFAVPSVITYTK